VQEEIQPMAPETAEFATAGQLEELYLRFGPGGLRLAYLLIGDHQAAEDCVQEASHLSQFDDPEHYFPGLIDFLRSL
jgi:hypothetical protein